MRTVLCIVLALLALSSCSSTHGDAPANADPACANEHEGELGNAEVNDDLILRGVVGASDDVFIARIRGKDSSYIGPFSDPVDVYQVDVLNTLMGKASGSVHAALGGVKNPDGSVCHYANLNLISDKIYLLATIFNPDRTVYAIHADSDAVTELSEQDLARLGTPDESEAVKAMREAIKAPIAPRM